MAEEDILDTLLTFSPSFLADDLPPLSPPPPHIPSDSDDKRVDPDLTGPPVQSTDSATPMAHHSHLPLALGTESTTITTCTPPLHELLLLDWDGIPKTLPAWWGASRCKKGQKKRKQTMAKNAMICNMECAATRQATSSLNIANKDHSDSMKSIRKAACFRGILEYLMWKRFTWGDFVEWVS